MIRDFLNKFFKVEKDNGSPHAETLGKAKAKLPAAERNRLLKLATDAVAASDYSRARELTRILLHADARDGSALAIAGFCSYFDGNYADSVSLLKLALEGGATDIRTWEFLAHGCGRLGRDEDALKYGNLALQRGTQNADLLNTMGLLCIRTERYEAAAEFLTKAVAMAPKKVRAPLINLALLDTRARIHLKASPFTGKSAQIREAVIRRLVTERQRSTLDDDDSELLLALISNDKKFFDIASEEVERLYQRKNLPDSLVEQMADIFVRQGDLRRALEMREQVMVLNEGDPAQKGVDLPLGLIMIAAGRDQWFRAWMMADQGFLRFYRSLLVQDLPIWKGERLGKKALLVTQDQGFGDLMLGLRLVKASVSRGLRVVFMVRPGVYELLEGSTELGEVVRYADQLDPSQYGIGAAAPLFSLIRILKLWPEDLKAPFLIRAPQHRCLSWRDALAKERRLRVGLALFGNPYRSDDWMRSIPLKNQDALAALKNIVWVNLAVDERGDRTEMLAKFGALDPTPDLKDFADTAAVIDMLDVVVAIDCSVAHLAAVLGKSVLVLTPATIEWRWRIGSDDQPWWPSAVTFRSPRPGVWDEPIARLSEQLMVLAVKKVS